MDSVTSARSMLLTEEEALAGGTTISCETTDEFGVDDIYVYCQEHFADWLRVIRVVSREQQELLPSHYLLGKTQIVLSKLLQATQTVCSFRILMAVKLVGTYLMMGGAPEVETMRQPRRALAQEEITLPYVIWLDTYISTRYTCLYGAVQTTAFVRSLKIRLLRGSPEAGSFGLVSGSPVLEVGQ